MTKTNTHEQITSSHQEINTSYQSDWEDVGAYVLGLENEPEFIEAAESSNLNRYSLEYAELLSGYAEAAVQQQGELIDDKIASQVKIIAGAPFIAHASLRINQLGSIRERGIRLNERDWDEFNELKRKAVAYNQNLSDYMYDYSDEAFSSIKQAMTDQAIDHFPSTNIEKADKITTGVATGARTEAATRHLFDDLKIPYRPSTPEEDLRGADIVVVLAENDYHIDIKRSLNQLPITNDNDETLEESHRMYAVIERDGHKRIMLFPGFTDSHLGDSLKLDRESISKDRADLISAQIMRAVIEASK